MGLLSATDHGDDAVLYSSGSTPFPETAALFPTAETRLAIDQSLGRALEAARQRLCAGPVRGASAFQDSVAKLAGFDFAQPRPLDDILDWVIREMEGGMVHITHPRYFGLFNPAPSFPAQCADRITAAFNPQLATATTSPFPVALEAHVITSFAARAGLAQGAGGHFTSGGAEANATALMCALTTSEPGFAVSGARAFRGRPVFYVSQDAHLAWLKIAHQTGIGRSAVRLVATDGGGRMDMGALAQSIASDRKAGCVPVMVAATAGTTAAGMIDPLSACAEQARACGAWFHVDAAWGGAALVSNRLLGLMAGMEQAFSITIDAHKWLAATMGCGMFLTARPAALSETFHATMSCMPSNTVGVDPYITTMQWSRRFLGLRVFVALATCGWRGMADHVERAVDVSEDLAARLEILGWRRANRSALAVLCMVPPAGAPSAKAIADSVVAEGIAWISATSFQGQEAVRICITNGTSTENDISLLVSALHARAMA